MKHTNHAGAHKEQGATDQQKKSNKVQNERNDAMGQQDQQSRTMKEHSGGKTNDNSDWQKGKQGNKK